MSNGKRFVSVDHSAVVARDDSLEKAESRTLYPADELKKRHENSSFTNESDNTGSVSTIDEPSKNFPDLK